MLWSVDVYSEEHWFKSFKFYILQDLGLFAESLRRLHAVHLYADFCFLAFRHICG